MASATAMGVSGDMRCGTRLRRCVSEPQLWRSVTVARAAMDQPPPTRLRTSRSMSAMSLIPNPIRSFLFDEGADNTEMLDSGEAEGRENEKRASWVERLVQVGNRWQDRQQAPEDTAHEDDHDDGDCEECAVTYESKWNRESFGKLLSTVELPETKLLAKLAVLCNLAYFIPEINAKVLRGRHGLWLVTSSLARKAEAAEIKAKLDADCNPPPPSTATATVACSDGREKILLHPSVAYHMASSAASYIQSRAKGILSLSTPHAGDDAAGAEVAAAVATSALTAVVAAEENARQQAARDLRSLHSSPCEWFIADDPATAARCFVIQGSDSLASWKANLFFEPCSFEGTDVLVHRGIYEVAKGLYAQFLPAVDDHIRRHGGRARLRFTGHSLGGSLAMLLSLMLAYRRRGTLPKDALLPVVTFGSPTVMCGGGRILDELGLPEYHVVSVMMHRDIVPRAFSCNYPHHVAQVLLRLNRAFRSHPCLHKEKLLYAPIGEQIILQPEKKSSPPHPLLPDGCGIFKLHHFHGDEASKAMAWSGLRAFLNSPHPLETLSDRKAYGSEGTILRDHVSSNYVKAMNENVRRKEWMGSQLWPLIAAPAVVPGLLWSPSWALCEEVASPV